MSEPTVETVRNPYPGLRPFRSDEKHLFFGREQQVDRMVEKLAARHFLAVVGGSGSGKSSLVNCGLRPALHRGNMASAGAAWRMAQMRPGNDPIGALARALAAPGVLFDEPMTGALSGKALVESTLRLGSLGLIDMVEQADLPSDTQVLVVADQFEELFRFRSLGRGAHLDGFSDAEDAVAFVRLLLEAAAQTEVPIYVVLTMRSDFLGDCDQFHGLPEAINEGQYLVPRLTRNEIRAAITGPAAVRGATLSPVLVTRLLNDVGDNPDQLSILQHALNRTWASWENEGGGKGPLDLVHYEAIGAMAHALDQHAERAYAELTTPRQQQICEKLFKALTDKANDPRGVRRPTTLGTLCALADATAAEVAEVIDVYRKPSRSFLMPPAGEALEPETVIDISHESLMRVWQRLIRWADEEAQSAQMYRRLADAAARHAVRKASLWRDPDLQLALDWCDKSQPNENWASRYGSGFDVALAFLRDSEAAHIAELEKEKERQQADAERLAKERELEQIKALAEAQRQRANDQAAARIRQRRMMWGLMAFLALAVGAAGFGWNQKLVAEEQKRLAENNSLEAEKLRILAEKQKKIAEEQSAFALKQKTLAEQQTALAEKKTRELDVQRGLAVNNANRAVEESRVARSGEVAAKSNSALAVDPELSLLLAMEAASIAPTQQSLNALRRALPESRIRKIITAKGKVYSVAYSPDQKLIASANEDHTIRIWDPDSGKVVRELRGHTKAVHLLVFSPDGRRIATEAADSTGKVWDVASGKELFTLEGLTGKYPALAFSPDGARIAAESGDKEASVWDVETRRKLYSVPHDKDIRMIVFSPDGKLLVTASDDAIAGVWDGFNGNPIASLRGHQKEVVAAAFSPDGKRVVTASLDGTARIFVTGNWDDKTIRTVSNNSPIYDVRVSNNRIVTASNDGKARIWDLQGKLLQELAGHDGPVTSAAFSPDGQFVVTASGMDQSSRFADARSIRGDNTARVWNVQSGRQVAQLRGHTGAVASTAFSPDGRYVVTGAWDGTGRIWATGTQSGVDLGPRIAGTPGFSPDGKLVIAPGPENSAVIMDSVTGKLVRQLRGHSHPVNRVALGLDGTALTADTDGNARVWDWKSEKVLAAKTGAQADATLGREAGLFVTASTGKGGVVRVWNHDRPLGTWTREGSDISRAALSPNGNLVVIVHRDKGGIATLWDYARDRRIDLLGHTGVIYSADFNLSGNLVVTASADKTARVWDTATGAPVGELMGHPDEVNRAAFSPKGDMIATTGDDNAARIWKWPKGKTLVLRGHNGPVYDAKFSSDGRFLLTASTDRNAKIWDTATGESIETFSNRVQPSLTWDSVAFSPEGTRIMTHSREGGIKLYPCELCGSLDELRALAKMRVTRSLTPDERERYLPVSGAR